MKEYILSFDKGKGRKSSEETTTLGYKRHYIFYKMRNTDDKAEKAKLVKQLKANRFQCSLIPYGDEMDANYKRLKYVRYADDFIIGVIGSKEDAKRIKEDIRIFLAERLALELSDEKTLITHSSEAAKFLSYEIDVRSSNDMRRSVNGQMKRAFNKRIRLMIGRDLIKNKLLEERMVEIKIHNGKEQWKPKSVPMLVINDDLEILDRYNKILRGFVNYYSLANNAAVLDSLGYIMQYSMYKTFAHKYRTKVSAILRKHLRDGRFKVQYQTKQGIIKERSFYYDGSYYMTKI